MWPLSQFNVGENVQFRADPERGTFTIDAKKFIEPENKSTCIIKKYLAKKDKPTEREEDSERGWFYRLKTLKGAVYERGEWYKEEDLEVEKK